MPVYWTERGKTYCRHGWCALGKCGPCELDRRRGWDGGTRYIRGQVMVARTCGGDVGVVRIEALSRGQIYRARLWSPAKQRFDRPCKVDATIGIIEPEVKGSLDEAHRLALSADSSRMEV